MSNNKEFWIKIVGESWYNAFPHLWNSDYMNKVLVYLNDKYNNATIYPSKKDIFKAFKLCPYDKLKVIIIGQDPYPNGTATGLAFANDDSNLRINPSLEKIRDCVERTIYDGLNLNFDITLESWAKQGVLLLNTSLTFERFKGGHFNVWNKFTNHILVNTPNGVHVCLWGNHAKSFKPNLHNKLHYIYEYVHPAYSARQNEDWKCEHFKQINDNIIKQNGKEEIIVW